MIGRRLNRRWLSVMVLAAPVYADCCKNSVAVVATLSGKAAVQSPGSRQKRAVAGFGLAFRRRNTGSGTAIPGNLDPFGRPPLPIRGRRQAEPPRERTSQVTAPPANCPRSLRFRGSPPSPPNPLRLPAPCAFVARLR